jgi:hypothetical protein
MQEKRRSCRSERACSFFVGFFLESVKIVDIGRLRVSAMSG